MTVRVIPLNSVHGLRFDLVLEDYSTVTLHVPANQIDPNLRITEIIRKKVLDYLDEFGYTVVNLHIIYC